jgi:hypothetical protein
MDSDKCFICNGTFQVHLRNGFPYCLKCIDEQKEELRIYEKSREIFFPEINEIIENKLYLGNYDQQREKDNLIKYKITHVLVCGDMEYFHPDDFVYKKLPLEDYMEFDIKQYFKEAIDFIDSSEIVFVHCHAGVSRSASIVIAYIMFKLKLNYEDAYQYVKLKRNVILPNMGFRKQLAEFENEMI